MKSISIFSLAFIGFVLWVVLASTASNRIERTCQPVLWFGDVVGLVAQSGFGESAGNRMRAYFEGVDYGCRFSVWQLFYGKEYKNKMNNQNKNEEKPVSNPNDDTHGIILK